MTELRDILNKLLENKPLTEGEESTALRLLANPIHSNQYCTICQMSTDRGVQTAIFDSHFCVDHAFALLMKQEGIQ